MKYKYNTSIDEKKNWKTKPDEKENESEKEWIKVAGQGRAEGNKEIKYYKTNFNNEKYNGIFYAVHSRRVGIIQFRYFIISFIYFLFFCYARRFKGKCVKKKP